MGLARGKIAGDPLPAVTACRVLKRRRSESETPWPSWCASRARDTTPGTRPRHSPQQFTFRSHPLPAPTFNPPAPTMSACRLPPALPCASQAVEHFAANLVDHPGRAALHGDAAVMQGEHDGAPARCRPLRPREPGPLSNMASKMLLTIWPLHALSARLVCALWPSKSSVALAVRMVSKPVARGRENALVLLPAGTVAVENFCSMSMHVLGRVGMEMTVLRAPWVRGPCTCRVGRLPGIVVANGSGV